MRDEVRECLLRVALHASREPDRLTRSDLDQVLAILRADPDPESTSLAGKALSFLVSSPLARAAIEELFAALREPGFSPRVYETLVQCLRYAVCWRRPLLNTQELAGLAELEHLRAHHQFLREEVLEPCLFGSPAAVAGKQLEAASPYCRYYLGQPVDFSLHAEVAKGLREGRRRVLFVHNISDGQGDEILRCGPLLQALVDSNPRLEITLFTKRTYLFSHPRVAVYDIREDPPLEPPYDAIVNFFEGNIQSLNHNLRVETRIRSLIQRHPPFLLVATSKGYDEFVFDRVEIAGRGVAEQLGLNQRGIANNRIANHYDPVFRLIAELGLPLRTGENPPVTEPVLAGIAWPEAESAWKELIAQNADGRPVALLLPYGGTHPLKGHTSPEDVAEEVRRLITQGWFVILAPSAEPWGSAERAREALACLGAIERGRVVIAPDPVVDPDRDHHGRMLLYFIRFADRTVAVEGWMIHAAYCLSKPYEILMLAYSEGDQWRPYAATYQQEVTQTPKQTARFARIFWLEQIRDAESLPVLRAALTDPDRDVRAAAARGLAHYPQGDARPALVALLEDPAPRVRAAAAEVLLSSYDNAEDATTNSDLLRAHLMIARQAPDWRAVAALGRAGRTAIETAVRSDDPVIEREAIRELGRLNKNAARANSLPVRRAPSWFRRRSSGPKILILTPVKDAADCIGGYEKGLMKLTYPHDLISVGVLEGDSSDSTFADMKKLQPRLRREFRSAGLWKKDFGFRLELGQPRWAEEVQAVRRTVLAKSRNQLLFRALEDEDWVLWLDVDVVEYPGDIIQKLLAVGKDIVHPNCVLAFGGPAFDRNAWREQGRLHMDDLRAEGALVKLDAVGGTMLLVRADLHREGLIFPPYPYGRHNPRIRPDNPELETEGFGLLAQDMGYQCWGLPYLEVRHRMK